MADRGIDRNPQEMASVTATAVNNQSHRPSSEYIQKILDENAQLIVMINDYQRAGKLQDCVPLQQILRRNLVYLASMADLSKNTQSLLLPPSLNLQQNMKSQVQQQQLHIGYRPHKSIVAMRSPSRQYRLSPQYQRQQTYQNFASTQSSAISSSQTGGSGGINVFNHSNQSYSGQGYGYQQPVHSANYLNPYYGNPPIEQHYQSYGPYGNQVDGRYAQNTVAAQPQNVASNYPSSGYVQNTVAAQPQNVASNYPSSGYAQNTVAAQPQNVASNYPSSGYAQQQVSSSSVYRPVTNQLSQYAEYVNARYGMQNTYSS